MTRWWVTDILNSTNGQVILGAWVIWVVLSITLHELGHGWAAIRRGDTTPIDTGHMTFNPIVHMGWTSLIVFAISGIAWGQMPVDPSRMRGKYADAYVSFAGPAVNFLLAIACVIIGGVLLAFESRSGTPNKTLDDLQMFFYIGGCLNVALGIFNLFPLPPLDGSRILGDFVPKYRSFVMSEGGAFLSFIGYAIAFMLAGPLVFGIGAFTVAFGQGLIGAGLNIVGFGSGAGGVQTP